MASHGVGVEVWNVDRPIVLPNSGSSSFYESALQKYQLTTVSSIRDGSWDAGTSDTKLPDTNLLG